MAFSKHTTVAIRSLIFVGIMGMLLSCGGTSRGSFETELTGFQIECIAFFQELESNLDLIQDETSAEAGGSALNEMLSRANELGEDWDWLGMNDNGDPGTDEDANEWMGIIWAVGNAQKQVDRLKSDSRLWPIVSPYLEPLSVGMPKDFFPQID